MGITNFLFFTWKREWFSKGSTKENDSFLFASHNDWPKW
jgi:hypothetical protein